MDDHLDLGPRLETVVNQLVSDGRYGSRDDVLREGVKLIEEREKYAAALDAALTEGLADIEAGRVHLLSDVAAELIAKYEKMAEDRGL